LLINAVEFFNEYLTKISQLETDKTLREAQIASLLQDKEGLFLTKYDLERKIAEMTTELKKAQAHEKDTVGELKGLQKRLDAKVAECDSLKYRIRHLEDQLALDGVMDGSNPNLLQMPEAERHATIDSTGSGRNLR
jgi:chromosome segregation ATPase